MKGTRGVIIEPRASSSLAAHLDRWCQTVGRGSLERNTLSDSSGNGENVRQPSALGIARLANEDGLQPESGSCRDRDLPRLSLVARGNFH